MKHVRLALTVIAAGLFILQGAAFAGNVQGTLLDVDPVAKTLSVSAPEGSSVVSYSDATIWPAGITDPESLIGQDVTVGTDDTTNEVLFVEAAAPAPEAA